MADASVDISVVIAQLLGEQQFATAVASAEPHAVFSEFGLFKSTVRSLLSGDFGGVAPCVWYFSQYLGQHWRQVGTPSYRAEVTRGLFKIRDMIAYADQGGVKRFVNEWFLGYRGGSVRVHLVSRATAAESQVVAATGGNQHMLSWHRTVNPQFRELYVGVPFGDIAHCKALYIEPSGESKRSPVVLLQMPCSPLPF